MARTAPPFVSDGTFDVLALGPMIDQEARAEASCLVIRRVAKRILRSAEFKPRLAAAGFQRHAVVAPEHLQGNLIVTDVVSHLEGADFVVFDLSPRPNELSPSPNVMYELGLVHALGLPHVLLKGKGGGLPFYVTQNRVRTVDFGKDASVEAALAPVFRSVLQRGGIGFADNAVSQYFGGAALVDISAAAGLAVGYYDAFIDYLLRAGGYLQRAEGAPFRHVVTVVPERFGPTAVDDEKTLAAGLARRGIALAKHEFPPIDGKPRGMLVKHAGPVIVDLATAAYAMRRSPRLLKLHELRRNRQASGRLLDALEAKMHARLHREFIRMVQFSLDSNARHQHMEAKALHFATPETAPALVERLMRRRR